MLRNGSTLTALATILLHFSGSRAYLPGSLLRRCTTCCLADGSLGFDAERLISTGSQICMIDYVTCIPCVASSQFDMPFCVRWNCVGAPARPMRQPFWMYAKSNVSAYRVFSLGCHVCSHAVSAPDEDTWQIVGWGVPSKSDPHSH